MEIVKFTKMHGCGNDYIYVNAMLFPIDDPSTAAIAWSNRHKGIGSDGLVLIDRSPIPEADFSMRIFNADGSEAMMCGNASRCIGKYLYERGLTEKQVVRLLTLSGVKTLFLHVVDGIVGSVTVDMGEPVLKDATLFDVGWAESLCKRGRLSLPACRKTECLSQWATRISLSLRMMLTRWAKRVLGLKVIWRFRSVATLSLHEVSAEMGLLPTGWRCSVLVSGNGAAASPWLVERVPALLPWRHV